MTIYYQDDHVALYHGDCLDVLAAMPDSSVDSIVTDPPYGLSNTTPEQVAETITRWVSGDREYLPTGRGFMGKDWDAFVPPVAVWDECLRVLKPGGHVVAFAGSRTHDFMTLSIRLAGFEIRDSLAWLYGSGFPKSMDVSKAIDKQREERHEEALKVTKRIAERAKELGISRRDINLKINGADHGGGSAQTWTTVISTGVHKPGVPTVEQWGRLREFLSLDDAALDTEVWRLNGRKGKPGDAWDSREVISERETTFLARKKADGSSIGGDMLMADERGMATIRETLPATPDAERWQGWGTALKPAFEPIVLARKPFPGTVAANVLAHGTGAINVDACRIGDGSESRTRNNEASQETRYATTGGTNFAAKPGVRGGSPSGRWPANVLLDQHAATWVDEQSGVLKTGGGDRRSNSREVYGRGFSGVEPERIFGANSGGASRFFYTAKAPKSERPVIEREDGTKIQHETVKPLKLMRWLLRLVTPPDGTTLDPFAGSGTTIEAAILEGFHPVGIERETDYLPLITTRITRAKTPAQTALNLGSIA